MRKTFLAAGAAIALLSRSLAAQEHREHDTTAADYHERPFSQGPRAGKTIGAPHLDVNVGLYHVGARSLDEFALRLHGQAALGIPLLEISTDLLFIPAFGATPTWSAVAQVAPIRESSPLYISGGIGGITGHNERDRLQGWVQAVAAVRLPVHGLTPFVQIGRALGREQDVELLLGIAHPLAPYRFHLP